MPDCAAGDFEFQRRTRVLERPEYLFEVDEHANAAGHQLLYAHLRVWHFSPSVFKQILADWRVFRSCCQAPLFAIGEVDDDRWHRFVSHLGFVFDRDVICLNGERRRQYRNLWPGKLEPLDKSISETITEKMGAGCELSTVMA